MWIMANTVFESTMNLSLSSMIMTVLTTALFIALFISITIFQRRTRDHSAYRLIKSFVQGSKILLVGLYIYTIGSILLVNWREYVNYSFIESGSISLSFVKVSLGVVGVAFVWFAHKLLIVLFDKVHNRWKIARHLLKSLRRFLIILLSVIVASLFIRYSDSVIDDLLRIRLFTIRDVTITTSFIVTFIFVLYGISVIIKLIEFVYQEQVSRKQMDVGRSKTVFQIIRYLIWVITIVVLLDSMGLNINVLVAGSAALFVGLGFGLQVLFNDFVSGLVILFDGSIRIGQIVEMQGGIIGKVLEVGLRSTTLLTRDNIIMIIPNHKLVSDNVINWDYNEAKTRFFVEVGVAYGSDVRLVEKVLVQSAQEQSQVLIHPSPFVYFSNFGNSSIDFKLFFWVSDAFYVEKIKSDIRFNVDHNFRVNNIEIPFPQSDLHLKSGWMSDFKFEMKE
ncbi:MAG: mechanosensitive ion channel [Marinilabiliaceae bacterium]|nr:mechanosensitive ion channel [Marinilabiliaceae bacterium]